MNGAKWVGNLNGGTAPVSKRFLIKASEVIAKGDWLTIEDATGKVDVATTGETLLGVANETVTGNSGGTNKVEVILALPGTLFLMDNDNDTNTFAQTDVGEYHDIDATGTGSQQIDTSTGATTTAQLLALEYNPQGFGYDDDTSIGLYTPAESYFSHV